MKKGGEPNIYIHFEKFLFYITLFGEGRGWGFLLRHIYIGFFKSG
jgi:hypothetical protein